MTDHSTSSPNAATPEQELAALLANVALVSKAALDMTQHCINLHDTIPDVIASHVTAALAAATAPAPAPAQPAGPEFAETVAVTPDQLDARWPPDSRYDDCDEQVLGVPKQSRMKKTSRAEALNYYRLSWGKGLVHKLNEVVAAPAVASAGPSHAHTQSQ
ncbi:hypothetical protein C8R43DRAFT_1116087 [Mycena crocata]|nr:hypothetical protein C8R43DRAFT_1116087 [Mycena crocata]